MKINNHRLTPTRKERVHFLGRPMRDIFARLKNPEHPLYSQIAHASDDSAPLFDEDSGDILEIKAGGGALNAACAASKAGISCNFSGSLGNDRAADSISHHLDSFDVENTCRRIQGACTGSCSYFFPGGGALIRTAAAESFSPEDINVASDTTWLYLEGYLLLNAVTQKTWSNTIIETSLPFMIDLPATGIIGKIHNELEKMLPHASIISGTKDEWEILSSFWKISPKTICLIKKGAAGASMRINDQAFSVPANTPRTQVDETACGDIFNGTYLAAYLQGTGPIDCLKKAVKAGTSAVTHYGGLSPDSTVDNSNTLLHS